MSLKLIPGTGPIPCTLMAVGEAPGKTEHEQGYPFAGKSGEVLNTYLQACSLSRDQMFLTNLYPYWPGPGNPEPTQAQITDHQAFLARDIVHVNPRFILALGRLSTQWFLGDVNLEEVHGLAHPWGTHSWVIPSYHPASALYNPEMATLVYYDILQFALYAKGKLSPDRVVHGGLTPNFYRQKKADLLPYLADGAVVAIDTEGVLGKPWGASVCSSNRPDHGIVASIKDVEESQVVTDTLVMHNAMYDLPMLKEMGVDLDYDHLVDTMVMAYLLRVEPQSLKALARRHLHLKMQDFDSLVRPYFEAKALEFVEDALKIEWPPAQEELEQDPDTKKYRVKKPHGIKTRLKTMLTHSAKPDSDLLHRWQALSTQMQAQIEQGVGREFPDFSLFQVPDRKAVPYSGRDAYVTLRLYNVLKPKIEAMGLTECLQMDMACLPMFAEMQSTGLMANPAHFARMAPEIQSQIDQADRLFFTKYNQGQPFNMDSGDQVADLLYTKLGLRPPHLTDGKTRGSVDESALDLLEGQHPAITDLKARRQLATNLSFVERIPKWIGPDLRVRPTIRLTRTETGRAATSDPNMMGIPVRSELGREIRNGFVSPPGRLLCTTDLSQIELRIMAHLSRDKRMVKAFKNGEDLHQITSDSLGIERYLAKTVNFGVMYGAGAHKLHLTLLEAGRTDMDEVDCAQVISDWFSLYSGVREWMGANLAEGRRHGYVRDMWGRIRYLPNLWLPIGHPLRSQAERHAGNFPIQAGAQGVIKRAMARLWKWRNTTPECGILFLLQIHDEILMEGNAYKPVSVMGYEPEVKRLMIADQTNLAVPLDASVSFGHCWGELK